VNIVDCPCGERIEAETEDELVDAVNQHLDAQHPAVAGHYTREQILTMSRQG
jgi:hypothetical protein